MRLAFLLTALLVAYGAHVRYAGYVYEDGHWTHPAALVRWNTRPLMQLSMLWARTYPQVHHAINLSLHAVVVALLGLLAYRLGLSRDGAWFAAALFSVHPLNSQAVAYLSARPELFAAIGVLGACLAVTWQSPYRWPLVVLALTFGLAGKESAIVALMLVPLTLATLRQRQLAGYALLASVLIALTGIQAYGGLYALINRGESSAWHGILASEWARIQLASTSRLLGQAVWPDALTVDPDVYLHIGITSGLGAAAVVVLASCAWTQRHTRPLLTYGLAWTLISLAPRYLIQTPRTALTEHQVYVPMMGLVLAFASLWDDRKGSIDGDTKESGR